MMHLLRSSKYLLVALLLLPVLATAQDVAADAPAPAESSDGVISKLVSPDLPAEVPATDVAVEDASADPSRLSWDDRVDDYERAELESSEEIENPDELYVELSDLLRVRARQFELNLNTARSRDDVADPYIEALQAEFPAADPKLLPVPSSVITVQQVHENFLALYAQRIRLLEYVSDDLQMQVMGTQLFGMAELTFESRAIWLELRYQALRIPAAGVQLLRMLTRAPLPLIWFCIYLALLVFVFRWWRHWFPETIRKVQTNLLAIRPRTNAIVSRLRGLWYLQRIRRPLEWYVFFYFLFDLVDFLQLEFVTEVGEIVIRWVLYAWFAVVFMDAIVARGAGGTGGDIGRTRLHSLRLLALWLLLLGLGLELASRLAGEGALYALVWRAFQVMAFPVVFIQLGLWRSELFRRVRLEDRDFISRAEFDHQRGLKKYTGAARLAGFLFANGLRRLILRRMGDLDPVRVGMADKASLVEESDTQCLDESVRAEFLDSQISYTKYSRAARRRLVEHINQGIGGRVVLTGERGIGKDGFIRQVCEEIESDHVVLDCDAGSARAIERQLATALGIGGPLDDADEIAAAMSAKDIRAVAVLNMHMLVRPVVGGFEELNEAMRLFDNLPVSVMRIMAVDRYSWQYIRRALADRAASVDLVELQAWTDEQIGDMISARCEQMGFDPDFGRVRVPSQYLEGDEERRSLRNRQGIFAMVASLSGGNPSIASRLFIDCIREDARGKQYATLPANADIRPVEQAAHHLMLVLRVIAQTESIRQEDIVANLRYPESVVSNALQVAQEKKWIDERDGQYSLTWSWFRTITRVLSRQNLLAGVRYSS